MGEHHPDGIGQVITVQTAAFSATPEDGSAAIGVSAFEKAELSKSDCPELTSTKIIISDGRGTGNGENFTKYY